MLFCLTTLNLVKVLKENAPVLKEGEMDKQVMAAVDAWVVDAMKIKPRFPYACLVITPTYIASGARLPEHSVRSIDTTKQVGSAFL